MTRNSTNRREFMSITGLGMAGVAGSNSTAALAAGSAHPDLIVYNSKIYTVDDAQPMAQAFAVKGGRFVAVGSNDEIKGYGGPATRRLDAGGATIVPGFHDAHIHADGQTLLYEVLVGNPFEVEFVTIDSIIEKLRKRAAQTPKGEWVRGYFYDDTKVKDGRLITRLDLDKVSTEHPVRVGHRGGHTSFYNSKAFELAGITKDSPDPPGGEFFHDASGLSGRVAERANAVIQKGGIYPSFTPAQDGERARKGAAHFSNELVRYGITSVQSSTRQFADLQALQQIRPDGLLKHRVSFEVSGDLLEAMIANGIRSGFGDDWVRLGATSENVVDGSFSERTARLGVAYPGISPPYYGIMTQPQDVLDAWAERVHRAGIRLNCHANGEAGVESTLDAYEKALKAYPVKGARPKITHCAIVNDNILKRMKAMDAVPATFTSYAFYNSDKFGYYGEEIMKRALPFRAFLNNGIPAAAGSDFAPGPFAPLMGIQGIVTRKGWDGKVWGLNQAVTVAEAIRIHTLNGAYCGDEDKVKGSITPGKYADFVMLEKDPHSVDPETIIKIKTLKTFTDGNEVYSA
jgi:predicted amidohydrolase YtcJ